MSFPRLDCNVERCTVPEAILRASGIRASSERADELTSNPQVIVEGRAALERCDWPAAFTALHAADSDPSALGTHDLERLALAVTWLGEWTICISARERAFALFSATGDLRGAAGLAIELCLDQVARQRQAVARMVRGANELLKGSESCSELARLEDLHALATAFVLGDLETGAVHGRAAVTLAHELAIGMSRPWLAVISLRSSYARETSGQG